MVFYEEVIMMIYVKDTYKPLRKSKKTTMSKPSKPRIRTIVSKFNPVVSGIMHRETPSYPSLNSNLGSTTKSDTVYYTGDAMIGIGKLHKSNSVPVFRQQEAEDQAKMRRS